jgi:hypothetical protein
MITGFGAPRIIGQPSELLGRGQSLGKAPALWLRRAKPAFAYAIVETLGGFPNPPALWLRRAKPAFAYAIVGTLGGVASPFGPPPAATSPLASLGLAKPLRDGPQRATRAREARGGRGGLSVPKSPKGELAGSPRD